MGEILKYTKKQLPHRELQEVVAYIFYLKNTPIYIA